MTPVLLTVFKYSENEGKETLEEIYAGVMSHKHIYARCVYGNTTAPQYIKLKRSFTRTPGIKSSLGEETETCLTVKEFTCLGSIDLSNDKRVSTLSKDDSIIPEIDKVWDMAYKAEHRYL